jgi:hypothetical protein
MSVKHALNSLLFRTIAELSATLGGPVGAILGLLTAAAKLVADLVYYVRMATEMLRMTFDTVREALDLALAQLRVAEDTWARRLTPIVSG